ncbi:MAG TPA: GAF domain-containing protein [Desulfuromonadales bacterium]|nr:GAF domain-containing protein [Desulfuromonadales bacterium]
MPDNTPHLSSTVSYDSYIQRMYAAVLLIIVFIIMLAFYFLSQSRIQSVALAEARTRNLSQVLAQNVGGTIDKINLVLLTSADSIEKQLATASLERLPLEPFLIREHHYVPELNRMLVVNSVGEIIAGSGKNFPRANVVNRDYFIALRDNPDLKLAISKPVAGVIDGKWIQVYARRISGPDGSFAGVITGSLSLDHFINDFSVIKMGEFGSITLRDKDLAVIARYPVPSEAGSSVGKSIVAGEFKELIASGKTSATYRAIYPVDNIERVYTYYKIADYPLYINVGMATRDALAPWQRQVRWVAGLTSTFILLICFAAWAMVKKWQLDEQADRQKLINEKRLRSIVSILQYRADSIQEFLDHALNEAIKLTDSRIGYIYFYLEESRQFVLNSWSNDVMKECSVVNPQTCYELDKTGIWGEAVRQRKPIILNDFDAANPLKKGYPEGHVHLRRFMTVPVFKDDTIVAVVGAANKESDYDETDVLQLTLLMDVVWKFVENRRGEEERRHLFDILESSMNEIYVFDAETLRFTYVNHGALSNLQYSFEQITSMTPVDIKPEMTETSFRGIVQPLLDNRTDKLTFETDHRRADGTCYPVEVNLQLGESGSRRVFLAVINDITDRKQAEVNKAHLLEQLHQSQKLESVGRLAGGVAHDFNNKLMVICGNTELAAMELDEGNDPGKLREHLEEISRAAEHSREITAQLLAFSRKQIVIPRILNANQVIADAQKTLTRLIGEHISCIFKPAENLWNIEIDPVQIDQIVMNMAVNARDAMPDGGAFTIETGNVTCTADQALAGGNCSPGDYVRIEFRDSGIGMEKETVKNIFEPFFTTKEPGKGTGLGLSTSYGIISQNKGFIEVDSTPGCGTVFTVYFPRRDAPPDSAIKTVSGDMSGCGTILVVEDEEPVRKISSMFLRKFGYTVYEAEGPARALEIASDTTLKLDLLMTDVVMPEMNGRTMAEIIRRSRPGIKVLFVSGHAPEQIALDISAFGNNYIEKPYSMEKLGERLKQMLNSAQEV